MRARARSASELKKADTSSIRDTAESIPSLSLAPPHDPQRARTAHAIVEQLECHRITDPQAVERPVLTHVRAMKEDLPSAGETDEPKTLSDQQPPDVPGREHAGRVGSLRDSGMRRHGASTENIKIRAHVPTIGDFSRTSMSYGRFPTYSARAMCSPLHGRAGRLGCRLVPELDFRRSESGVARYAGGGIVRGKSERTTVTRLGERTIPAGLS